MARPHRVQFATQRATSIRAPSWPRRGSSLPTLRRSEDSFVDELFAGVVEPRLSADAGAFPALLCRRQPRALRARSAHVRRPPAVVRQHALDAGRRRARHRRAGGRRRPGDLRPAHPGRRRAARGSRASTSPITARCAAWSRRVHRDFGAAMLVDCHSMPSATGSRDERPRADVVLGDRYGTSCVPARLRDDRDDAARASAIRSAATSPMRAASSPSTTAIRPPACTRSSSRSTARSTWTSARYQKLPRFAEVAAILGAPGRPARGDSDGGIAALSGRGGVTLRRTHINNSNTT